MAINSNWSHFEVICVGVSSLVYNLPTVEFSPGECCKHLWFVQNQARRGHLKVVRLLVLCRSDLDIVWVVRCFGVILFPVTPCNFHLISFFIMIWQKLSQIWKKKSFSRFYLFTFLLFKYSVLTIPYLTILFLPYLIIYFFPFKVLVQIICFNFLIKARCNLIMMETNLLPAVANLQK